MNLEDILNESTIFIDTNVLIYAKGQRSPQCCQLLHRCEQGGLNGVITLVTLAELCHRRMVQEAQATALVGSNPARALSEKPALVRRLNGYAEEVRDLLDSRLTIIELQALDFHVALELQKQHGLLTNDSLNIAVAKRLGIKEIATADKAFDSVQGLIVYKPDDLAA